MQLSDHQSLPVSQAHAWAALNDIALLQQAIPGCESITPNGENTYDVSILAVIGPVKARFAGTLHLGDIVPPTSYALNFEAKSPAGHGKGTASVRLTEVAFHQTQLDYEAQASVGGKLAQIGSRLVDMAAEKMAGEFFDNFRRLLIEKYGSEEAREAEAHARAAAPQGLFARLWAWLGGLFGARPPAGKA